MVSASGCEQQLLAILSLKGTTVTVDALTCQRVIAQQIVEQGGDYVLALTGNQATPHDDVVRFLDNQGSKVKTAKPDVDAGHGRIETRTATVSIDLAWLCDTHG
jgi:predicted transposase YbfD/YdcC